MERFFVYVLYSKHLDKFYTGVTTQSVENRLEKHLSKAYSPRNFTQKSDDWELYWSLEGNTFSQVRKIELHLKKMKSRKYFENLNSYPEIGEKLLRKYESF